MIMKNYKVEWVSIEIDTHCNLGCTMCPIGHNKVKNQGRISLDTFEKIVKVSVGHTDKIALAVMGEPLLHPELPQMVAIVKKYGLNAFVWTNGMLLDEKKRKHYWKQALINYFLVMRLLIRSCMKK